ncbi:hypothetical protein LOF17_00005 [Sinorhizobium meliloti]|uniref:hypothetical protein n=1 Tax=Rhizobium meliloti TaxID=382 RepID=UPI00238168B3|nr:hypothetical protein [Sinorhizobium meliloti]MDE4586297.1 hypothetical protein [Sinorhizobium meliloti]
MRSSTGLQFLHQQKTTHALLELAIGERVVFEDNNGRTQAGIVIRRNRKTVTVHCDNARQWNVSPQLLGKEKRPDEGNRQAGAVFEKDLTLTRHHDELRQSGNWLS